MGALADAALSFDGLRAASTEVSAREARGEETSAALATFEDDLDNELGRLVAELSWGGCVPGDLFEMTITEGGTTPTLHVPPIRDRVVKRALLGA